jgi:thiamine pyrophosphate-dependent acetolactate synthase large subunit-like protein/nitrite reductase/ring-hydroxylating ferredoxin subunit
VTEPQLVWHRVLDVNDLPDGRVATVEAGDRAIAVTHFKGEFAAFDNRCPHQGGPLGEGSIERGWLRCPWHGYDYDPHTGEPPAGFTDCAIAVEVREDALFIGLPPAEPHIDTISDVMVQTMVNWGVTHVFGMVGHSNLGLADAFRRQEEAGTLTYIGVRHEGAAAFAASAFAKLTGRPAACFGIAGPGATNLLTGLWDAKMDRAPVLALTGQIDTQVLGPGMFQEVDLAAAYGSVSRWTQTVLPDSQHAELMSLALKHATIERDVTHLIFPNDVQTLPAGDERPGSPAGRVPDLDVRAPDDVVERATKLIEQAQRPMIIAGYGARFHIPQLTALAEQLGAPIATTFKAKGLVADSHALAAGVLGRCGTPVASWLMNEADLLIVLGTSFSNHTGIAEYKPIIQVDFDPMAIGKSHAVTVPMLASVGAACEQIEAALGTLAAVDQRVDIAERWRIWRAEKARRAEDDRGSGVNAANVFAALTRHAPRDAVIAVDVGNNTYSFGRYFESSGDQSVLMSGYLGSIGFGYPAAMGAWAAAPDRPTIAVTGDGGFGQYLGELTTAVKYGMKITHILLNDGALGKISKEQRASQFPVWQTSLHNPDFSRYAENCGALGIRVTERADLDAALERAFAHDGPALVEVITDSDLL